MDCTLSVREHRYHSVLGPLAPVSRGSGYVAPNSLHGHGSSGSSAPTMYGSMHHRSGTSSATTMNNQFWGVNINQSPPGSAGNASIATFSAGSGSGHHPGSSHHSHASARGNISGRGRHATRPNSLPNISESPREQHDRRPHKSWN